MENIFIKERVDFPDDTIIFRDNFSSVGFPRKRKCAIFLTNERSIFATVFYMIFKVIKLVHSKGQR